MTNIKVRCIITIKGSKPYNFITRYSTVQLLARAYPDSTIIFMGVADSEQEPEKLGILLF